MKPFYHRYIALVCFVAFLFGAALPVVAKSDAEFTYALQIEQAERYGRLLHEYDQAADLAATFLAEATGTPLETIHDGLAVEQVDKQFRAVYAQEGAAVYEVMVRRGQVRRDTFKDGDAVGPLTTIQQGILKARAAAQEMDFAKCDGTYRYIPVPIRQETDEWLYRVYVLLQPPSETHTPIGGHFRADISGDDFSVQGFTANANSCLMIGPPEDVPEKGQVVGAMSTTSLFTHPQDIHVFLGLKFEMPYFLRTDANLVIWKIEYGLISVFQE